ncbi:MAG: hypothetical protein EOP76_09565 [Variovorax sp.]|nr:MAG: hypothetical protein EOP76_09565 [Variovorax sp.]
MELLTALAISYPKLFIACCRALLSVAVLFGLLGLRLDRIGHRIERVSNRAGIAPPDLMAAFPWWLRMFVPESFGGWVYLGTWVCLGVCMIQLGKWGKKFGQ